MRVLGHRSIRGATIHHDGPVDRIVVTDGDADKLRSAAKGLTGDGFGQVLASLAGHLRQEAGFQKPWSNAWQDADGDWIVLTEANNEYVARAGMEAAVDVARAVLAGEKPDLAAAVAHVQSEAANASTARLLEHAAAASEVPVIKLGDQHLQLGWGVHRRTFWGSMTDATSGLGHEIANDHERSKQTLESRGVPMPRFEAVSTFRGAVEVAEELQYPLTIRPLRGPGGVTRDIRDQDALEAAYDLAKQHHRWIVVEDHVRGDVHRIIVHDGQVIAAVREDGTDVSQTLHPAVALVAGRAARIVGADLVAVELIAPNLEEPLEDTRGKFVAMEPCPDLASFPGGDEVAQSLVDACFPEGGRIPLIAVTGTNGKTTTVRLLAHILKFSGQRVGMACTGAIEVENQVILKGDYSGPMAARTVLREPGVTAAVCEVARGGLLTRGLGFDHCDVAVFLNVGSDHLGSGGIDTVEDLANLKAVVARSAAPDGVVVLNADDPLVWKHRDIDARIIPFTMDANHPDLQAHLEADPQNVAVTIVDDCIVLQRGAASFNVCNVMDIPITLDGAARFNIQNSMAAVAASYAIGATEEDTRAALRSFNPSTGQLPGRMNLVTLGGVKVLVDYGHNVPALQALADTLPRLGSGRRINVANASGNRRDEDLLAFGNAIAGMYDRIILCDPDPRGRTEGATAAVIEQGIRDASFDMDNYTLELDEGKALRMALAESRPGDLVVLQADDVDATISLINSLRARLEAGESPADLNMELLA